MRAFWTGDLAFGMVTIPVKLYTATQDLSPQFHQLHTACGTRINMVRRCATCEKDVEWSEIGKGYEVSKDKYALFTKDELTKLDGGEDGKGLIEIVQFIDRVEIDASYIDKSYWIAPGGKSPKSARGFELLRAVLADTGRAAVVKVKFRSRPRIGIVEARGKFLALHSMRFADEIIGSGELAPPDVKVTDRELAMAHALVESLAAPFDPAKLPDAYRANVLAAANAKAEGGEVGGVPALPAKPADVVDLADLLAASLAKRSA
jgi:DNA end-binding protein Ku